VTPSHPGLYVEEMGGPRAIEGVPISVAAFIGRATQGPRDTDAKASPTEVTNWAEYERIFGGLEGAGTLGYAVSQFFANGGRKALIVRVGGAGDGPIGDADISAPELESAGRGIWALDRARDVNLLCIPPLAHDVGGDIGAATRQAAATYCRKRRAFFIADALSRWQSHADVLGPGGAGGGEFGLAPDANAALYFPFLRVADPLQGGAAVDVAPCGAVAGIMARIDAARGVWKPPAGAEADVRGVIGPSIALNDLEAGELNPQAVNCLRQFPGKGTLVWGARTWRGQTTGPDWKYVNVRRLALFLEESIDRGTQWAAFEPNDEALWTAIRQNVGAFLHQLFRAGAFQGAREQDAFYVRCDRTTMSQGDIDCGRLIIEIGMAPLRPAEFVIIRICHMVKSLGEKR